MIKKLFFQLFYKKEDIFDAVSKGDAKRVKMLLKRGANPNWCDADGWSLLHNAVKKNQIEIIKNLIVAGANVHCGHKVFGTTPLHTAAEYGSKEAALSLLNNGVNANVEWKNGIYSGEGMTPIISAVQGKHYDVVKILIEHGANVNVHGGSPLDWAVHKGYSEIATLLRKHGAKPGKGIKWANDPSISMDA